MKNIFFLSMLALLVFGCTPKTTDTATGATIPTTPDVKVPTTIEEAKEMVSAKEDWRSNVPKPGPAPKIQIGDSETFTLDNGLKVIVVENHKLPRVSYQLFVDAPEVMQGESVGYIDFMGDLLNKGTASKSKAQIDETVDFMGASLNTSASGVFASSLTRHTDKLMGVIADVVKNPSFPKEEFEKIKKQTLSGLAQSKEDPQAIAGNVSDVMRYGKDHPYGEVTREETIENITLDKIKSYYQNYFRPNYSYLIVVGDTDVAKTKALVNKYLGGWKKGAPVKRETFAMPQAPDFTTVDFVNKTGAVQSVINVTYPVDLKPGSEDVIKARVANTLLGGFFQSRLNDNLRETKAYTYGAGSRLSYDDKVGYFTASASVRNEVTDSSVVEFVREMNRLRNEVAPAEEIELVKSVIAGNFARSLERPETVARFALNTARYNLPADYYATYLEKLSKVTPEDVQEMAQKYFLTENAHIVIVGNQDEVADKLGLFSKDGKVRYYSVYGDPIEDSKMATPDGVTAETVIQDYVKAIGGLSKLKAVKDLYIQMTTSMQGHNMTIDNYYVDNSKMANFVKMGSTVVQSMVFDGTRAKMVGGMAGEKLIEGEEAAQHKASALMFEELHYDNLGYKLELKGIEKVDGKDAYKVIVESPDGKKSTQFFDKNSKLKIKSVDETSTMTISNYKAVDGIQFPHTMKVSGGGMPMTMEMTVKSIAVNKGVDAGMFKLD